MSSLFQSSPVAKDRLLAMSLRRFSSCCRHESIVCTAGIVILSEAKDLSSISDFQFSQILKKTGIAFLNRFRAIYLNILMADCG